MSRKSKDMLDTSGILSDGKKNKNNIIKIVNYMHTFVSISIASSCQDRVKLRQVE